MIKEGGEGGDAVLWLILSLTSNMVKFLLACLRQAVVVRFIVRLAQISCYSNSEKEIL